MGRTYNQFRSRIEERSKKLNVAITPMEHGWRLNGVVDLFKRMQTVHDLTQKKYYKFESPLEGIDFAFELAMQYDPKHPFKRTPSGHMTYQEFKYNKQQSLDFE